jgi:translation initiation factor 3 subunit I
LIIDTLQTGEINNSVKQHNKQINDIQLSKDGNWFVTASKDFTAKVYHSLSLLLAKTGCRNEMFGIHLFDKL